jgi:hypothetical protein
MSQSRHTTSTAIPLSTYISIIDIIIIIVIVIIIFSNYYHPDWEALGGFGDEFCGGAYDFGGEAVGAPCGGPDD